MLLTFWESSLSPISSGLEGGFAPASPINDPTQEVSPPAKPWAAILCPPHLLLSAPGGVVTPASDFLHRASWSSCDSIERSASVETKAYQLLVCSRESSNRKLH